MKRGKKFIAIAITGLCLSLSTPMIPSLSPTSNMATVEAKSKKSVITLKKFKKVKTGMTYKKVCSIIGSKGKLLSNTDLGLGKKYVTKTYVWYGSDKISNATFMFQGGKLTSKSQILLK